MADRWNLVVIGAGPGGYEAAVEGAKKGMRVALVENRELGGTCLNRGCIPQRPSCIQRNYIMNFSQGHPSAFGQTRQPLT